MLFIQIYSHVLQLLISLQQDIYDTNCDDMITQSPQIKGIADQRLFVPVHAG